VVLLGVPAFRPEVGGRGSPKSQQPALPEQRDLFEGLAEIKLEIRPLRPAEMGSAKVIGLAVAAFWSSRFIKRVRP